MSIGSLRARGNAKAPRVRSSSRARRLCLSPPDWRVRAVVHAEDGGSASRDDVCRMFFFVFNARYRVYLQKYARHDAPARRARVESAQPTSAAPPEDDEEAPRFLAWMAFADVAVVVVAIVGAMWGAISAYRTAQRTDAALEVTSVLAAPPGGARASSSVPATAPAPVARIRF